MWLAGKNALITGSSRGIGRGIALKLAERGAHIGITYYQNEQSARDVLTKVRERGSDGFVAQVDVCDAGSVAQLLQRTRSEFGSLDILVSCRAGKRLRVPRRGGSLRPAWPSRRCQRGHKGSKGSRRSKRSRVFSSSTSTPSIPSIP